MFPSLGQRFYYAMQLTIKTTNNKAMSKALVCLSITKVLEAKKVNIWVGSEVVLNQVSREVRRKVGETKEAFIDSKDKKRSLPIFQHQANSKEIKLEGRQGGVGGF